MQIDAYEFGAIHVDGKTYRSDLILLPDRVSDNWWRKEGHCLYPEDLGEVVAAGPRILVLGTGYYGRMQVPEATRTYLESKGIRLHQAATREAVEKFNKNIDDIFKEDGLPDSAKMLKLAKLIAENPDIVEQLDKVNGIIEKLGWERGTRIGILDSSEQTLEDQEQPQLEGEKD